LNHIIAYNSFDITKSTCLKTKKWDSRYLTISSHRYSNRC